MSITGNLADFSLPEIFRFIEQGNKSGLLTVRTLSESQITPPSTFYIWMDKGTLVAATNHIDRQGLVKLIAQYPWVSDRVVTKLAEFCPPDKPLGLYLKNQGALQGEQLEHLFQIQIVQQLCPLLQLKDALFKFEQNAPIPTQEMTGLSIPARFLEIMLKEVIWLQKIFEQRKRQREQSQASIDCHSFCNQLSLILDIAFFHSLKLSLFDTNNTLAKLTQLLDLCDRPYELPKSRSPQVMCCTGG
jgi:hypothetical protein